MKEEMRENLRDEGIWLRGVFMLFFLIAYNIAEVLIVLITLFQFVTVLLTRRVNETVLRLGNNLSIFAFEVFQYVTFNSNDRPFPFSPWPDEESDADQWRDDGIAEAEFEEVKTDADAEPATEPEPKPDDNIKNVDS
jgi:hypothetical protein